MGWYDWRSAVTDCDSSTSIKAHSVIRMCLFYVPTDKKYGIIKSIVDRIVLYIGTLRLVQL